MTLQTQQPALGTGMSRGISATVLESLLRMANTILNTYRSRPGKPIYEKMATAKSLVAQCEYDWLELKTSIRKLSAQERWQKIAANLAHGSLTSASQGDSEPLPAKEIEGVIERMPRSEVWTSQVKYETLGAAREFYSEATT